MDVEAYWSTLKKKAKALTGVDKMKTGFFSNKSNVAAKLGALVKAKPGKEPALAKAAIGSIDEYLSKVHNTTLEAAKKNKTLTPEQIKSMDIIETGLGKLKKHLKAVMDGTATVTIERNADEDAMWAAVKKDALAFLDLRKKAGEAMLALKSDLENAIEECKRLLKMSQKALATAQSSKSEGNTMVNQMQFDILSRAVETANGHFTNFNARAAKEIRDGSSLQMKARANFSRLKEIPPGKLDKFEKEAAKLLEPSWKHGQGNEKLVKVIKGEAEKISVVAEQAEAFSLAAIQPEKVLKRLEDMKKSLNTTTTVLSKNNQLDQKTVDKWKEKYSADCSGHTKGPADYIKITSQILGDMSSRNETGGASIATYKQRLAAVNGETAQIPAIKSLLEEMTGIVNTYEANITRWDSTIDELKLHLAKLKQDNNV